MTYTKPYALRDQLIALFHRELYGKRLWESSEDTKPFFARLLRNFFRLRISHVEALVNPQLCALRMQEATYFKRHEHFSL